MDFGIVKSCIVNNNTDNKNGTLSIETINPAGEYNINFKFNKFFQGKFPEKMPYFNASDEINGEENINKGQVACLSDIYIGVYKNSQIVFDNIKENYHSLQSFAKENSISPVRLTYRKLWNSIAVESSVIKINPFNIYNYFLNNKIENISYFILSYKNYTYEVETINDKKYFKIFLNKPLETTSRRSPDIADFLLFSGLRDKEDVLHKAYVGFSPIYSTTREEQTLDNLCDFIPDREVDIDCSFVKEKDTIYKKINYMFIDDFGKF